MLLDASAVMALLLDETGAQRTLDVISKQPCFMSSVNLTEIEGKLVGRGEFTSAQVRSALIPLLALVTELPFDLTCREAAAFYYARKAPYGLSLGDAACLGTAEAHQLGVLTAEQRWATIPDLPFKIQVIR